MFPNLFFDSWLIKFNDLIKSAVSSGFEHIIFFRSFDEEEKGVLELLIRPDKILKTSSTPNVTFVFVNAIKFASQ